MILKKLNIQTQNMEMTTLFKTTPKQLIEDRTVNLVPTYSLHLYEIKFLELEITLYATKGEIKGKQKEKWKLNIKSATNPFINNGDLPARYIGTMVAHSLGESWINIWFELRLTLSSTSYLISSFSIFPNPTQLSCICWDPKFSYEKE